jgi:L-lactate utilization protein LutB
MDAQIEIALSSLRARHINGIFAEDDSEANRKILSLIPSDATVGIGDSTSMRQLGILKVLRERGIRIINPFDPKTEDMDIQEYRQQRERVRKETTVSDVFLTGTNAMTQDGRLVNVDAVGNRVAGMFWGHPI